MHSTTHEDTLIKIQALVAAVQFLTGNDEERLVQADLLDVIENIARVATESRGGRNESIKPLRNGDGS